MQPRPDGAQLGLELAEGGPERRRDPARPRAPLLRPGTQLANDLFEAALPVLETIAFERRGELRPWR
jgi:hypothetical protein